MNALLAALAFVVISANDGEGKELMLDGQCKDHEKVAQQKFEVKKGITLYVTEQVEHVWFCYTVPEGQSGVLDMRLESPGLEGPLHLHASAQLGEWAADDENAGPTSPDDPRWWNTPGWYANPMRFGGMQVDEAASYPRFHPSPGREIQLAKSRFGVGEWKLHIYIDHFEHGAISSEGARFPAEGMLSLTVGE